MTTIAAYSAADEFLKLAPTTRRVYLMYQRMIENELAASRWPS